jgi:ubiquinone/menaquinone biosynthesis C-methylase UbiE
MIAAARSGAVREHAPVEYLVAGGANLPFQNGSFDLVTIVTVLAFIPEPALVLDNITRVLKPKGRLVIGDLGRWSLWALSRRIRGWQGAAPLWASARFWTSGELRRLVEESGLRVERVAGAIYYPRSELWARAMAPLEPFLGELTTFGAAFIGLSAIKP